jgi:hypothetical protein
MTHPAIVLTEVLIRNHQAAPKPEATGPGIVMLWQYSQRRNQATLGGAENSDFNFTLAGPDVYLCLSPEQRIHRIFKRQCRVSGYKECALP